MYRLEVLLVLFLVTLETTIEGRSILYKTKDETIPSRRLLAQRHFKYKENIRGSQLRRPSMYRSMVFDPRSPWRRNKLPHNSKPFGYLRSGGFMQQRGPTNRNSLSRENSVLFHPQPADVKRFDRLRQRNQQVHAPRYNEFLAPSTETASVERRDGPVNKQQHVSTNPGATRTMPAQGNPRRKLSLNFDLNGSRVSKPRTISVKAKNIRNIQLSHLINKAIIDMQKDGRRTRIIFSRNTRRHPIKAETEVGIHAPKSSNSVSLELSQKQSRIDKAILSTQNDKNANLTLTTPFPVEISTITEILGKQDLTNISTHQQTPYVDNKMQTSIATSDIQVAMTTVAGVAIPSNNSDQSTANNMYSSSFTTSVSRNDVTTEEPDVADAPEVADAPDVDNIVPTGTTSRYPLYNGLDYD